MGLEDDTMVPYLAKLEKEGFFILDQFLPDAQFQALRAHAAALFQQGTFQVSHIGQGDMRQQQTVVRSDLISWLDPLAKEGPVYDYCQVLMALKERLNQTFFLGLNEFEAHFAVYAPGAAYKKHRDQFAHNTDRKISCVFYLNEAWQENDGGQLVLYSETDTIVQHIMPVSNRLVCFQSHLLHEVLESQRERQSIAGWFKVRPLLCTP